MKLRHKLITYSTCVLGVSWILCAFLDKRIHESEFLLFGGIFIIGYGAILGIHWANMGRRK